MGVYVFLSFPLMDKDKLFSNQCFQNRLRASRARKLLQKKAALKEEKKAAAIAAGLDWQSDDTNDESEVNLAHT